MIIDGIPASSVSPNTLPSERAIAAFLRFIERKLGVTIVRERDGYGGHLSGVLQLANVLKSEGIVREFGRHGYVPDEPQLHSWQAICNVASRHVGAGATWESDEGALTAALVEALERYIWVTQTDYFQDPIRATEEKMAAISPLLSPKRFAGSKQSRSDAEYLWIKGRSLVSGNDTYVPAQVVSGAKNYDGRTDEQEIRMATTNGLASWPTQDGARLGGALELIERDAFMIAWLNQLTLPRLALDALYMEDPALAKSMEICYRYRLKPHVVQLLTDAPTHAVLLVLEDMSGLAPRFAVGLRAHSSLPRAIQKAMTEALRARRFARFSPEKSEWDSATPVSQIGHRDRLFYWSEPQNAAKLEFLIQGPERVAEEMPWENDAEGHHLRKIVQWCKNKNYECACVPLGASAKNPTPLHIEMTVIPELQPIHLFESTHTFGTRISSIPKQFGYSPLPSPFISEPHPFS